MGLSKGCRGCKTTKFLPLSLLSSLRKRPKHQHDGVKISIPFDGVGSLLLGWDLA
jgi:hypothetical protein